MNDIREELLQMRRERWIAQADLVIKIGFYVALGILGWVGVLCIR